MPSKNREKIYLPESYYHVYNRGVNKRTIFKNQDDYAVFLNLLKRYLNNTPTKDDKGREYEWLHEQIELVAFCLMPNHYHLLIYQHEPHAMTRLLRGVAGAYGTYFNKKYRRVGPLFQDRYKASMITQDSYLQHISRYIHLNPPRYRHWQFSSLPYYEGYKTAGWVSPGRILELFNSKEDYSSFVADYEDHQRMLEVIGHELAD